MEDPTAVALPTTEPPEAPPETVSVEPPRLRAVPDSVRAALLAVDQEMTQCMEAIAAAEKQAAGLREARQRLLTIRRAIVEPHGLNYRTFYQWERRANGKWMPIPLALPPEVERALRTQRVS